MNDTSAVVLVIQSALWLVVLAASLRLIYELRMNERNRLHENHHLLMAAESLSASLTVVRDLLAQPERLTPKKCSCQRAGAFSSGSDALTPKEG